MPLFVVVSLALAADALTPEERAVAHLAREVPAWPKENDCFSCHHNGVAAGALYAARRKGLKVSNEPLEETTRWLARPEKWEYKRDGAAPTDKALMRVQFAAALVEAVEAGVVGDRKPLLAAARLVAAEQQKDGSWQVDAEGSLGSPATLGPALATHLARRTLAEADAKEHREAVARADRWLRGAKAESVLDAAGVLLALEGADDDRAVSQKRHCLELIRKGQDKEGGWGPYPKSAPEAFDTAAALLALSRYPGEEGVKAMTKRGREYLVAAQRKDGSWPETTRPDGGVSYAQRTATAGWALRALLATGE
jgi:hypothetical protein